VIFEQLNPGPCLSYLVADEHSHQAMIVDPVLEHVPAYIELLHQRELTLTHVLDTHSHADHLSGAAALFDITECEYVAHRKAPAGCVTRRVDDTSVLFIGEIEVGIMATPGHTEDSMTLLIGNRLLTGDALFLDEGGAGRDDLPGGDAAAHFESLQRLAQLNDDFIVCPAHDYHGRTPSTLRQQKKTNPHLQIQSKQAFVQYLEDLKLGPADWMHDVLAANYACARDPRAAWIPADAPACEVKGTLSGSANEIQVASMSVSELRHAMERGEAPILVDVRDAEELGEALGHLPDIIHIPVTELSHRLSELDAYREKPVVTVCRSGGRALTAAQILMQDGFTSVRVLNGGMQAWHR
jgi:sulfur dioxygenase